MRVVICFLVFLIAKKKYFRNDGDVSLLKIDFES